jgi:hypothetical protein
VDIKVNPRKYGREREALLAPLAQQYDIDYHREVVAPGSTRRQIAFQLVGCGADLLSALRYPDAIPTTDSRVAKSTARMVGRRFREEERRRAAVFLAEANATWNSEMMSRAGEADSASVHEHLRTLIQEFFPLDATDRDELEALRVEYRVMDDHAIAGRHPATGW